MATQRVIAGISGGVDSAVAALRLLEQGYEVEGLFMKNWEEDDSAEYCSAAEDLADAEQVCDQLGITLHTVNFSAEYWDRVFEYFLAELRQGRTPNPDVMCNREIKFKAFLDYALDQGADMIATGHYARIAHSNDQAHLLKGKDANKDQSYFLYLLGQRALQHSLFPIGEMEKPDVRALAEKAGFGNYSKKDSTGICFIGERRFKDFIAQYLPAQPGDMVSTEGEVIGQHNGLMYYTLGQRQGLGIGGIHDKPENPWYVVRKDLDNNVLTVAQGHDHPLLLSSTLHAVDSHWISGKAPDFPLRCSAKTRYRQSDQACTVHTSDNNGLKVSFDQPQRAVTPGQSLVLYNGDACLGGAIIDTTT